MGKIVDGGPRVVDVPAQEPGLSSQQLRVELAACRARLIDCRAVLAIPQVLHEVARLIAAEPTWMEHIVTILEALDDGEPGFDAELTRFAGVVDARIQGAWQVRA